MSKQFNFRCPDDLYAAIEAQAAARGIEKTAVVLDAVRTQLGLSAPEKLSNADAGLSLRVDQLAAQLAAVIAQVAELQQAPALLPTRAATTPTQPAPPIDGQTSIFDTPPNQAREDEPAQPLDTPATSDGWMHVNEGFRLAGGDPDNDKSKVFTLDGSKGYTLNSFRLKVNDITAFGFERHPAKGVAKVRPLPALLQHLAAKRNAEG